MFVLTVFMYVAVFVFSVVIHEISHGYIAHLRGDDTAKLRGRITLNPLPHIDLFGSIILPAAFLLLKVPVFFGWAKPVPIDCRNFENPKLDVLIVSLAGPIANLLLALVSGLIIRFIGIFPSFEAGFGTAIQLFLYVMLTINVILTIVNLIPIPPLDGSKVVAFLMPKDIVAKYMNINPFICLIVVLLLLSSRVVGNLLYPVIKFSIKIFSGIPY